jgi:hypothetical protein
MRDALRIRRVAVLAGLFFSAAGSMVRAQAWTLPPGEAYVKVSYGKGTASEQFTFDGRRTEFIDGLPGDTFRDRSLYLYSEIGLSRHATLVLNVPYKRLFLRDHAFRFRVFGFGTAQVGLRVGILPLLGIRNSPHALSVTGTLGLPTGYTRNYAPSVGPGQIDGQGTLAYGISFWPFPAYAQASAGFRYRSDVFFLSGATACRPGNDIDCIADRKPPYGHEMIYTTEVGLTPLEGALLIQGLIGGIRSIDAPTVGFSALYPIPTHQRFVKVGAGLGIYPFRIVQVPALASLGFSAQYYHTPRGQNTLRSRDLFLGFDYRLVRR